MSVPITFDPAKDRANLAKHGIRLSLAEGFDFDTALIREDRDTAGEQRFQAIGRIGNRLFFFVFTYRGEEVRAVSLRPASKKDRRDYERESWEL